MTGAHYHTLLFFYGDGVSHSLFAWAVYNHDSPDLSLPSSWDYRRELPVPSCILFLRQSLKLTLSGLALNSILLPLPPK
jgi:hypothetical protein